MDDKKSRILYIKQYLEEYSDELHPKTVTDILNNLKTEGIEASRPTVIRELKLLTDAGIDVICNDGKPKHYLIGDRGFELPELKLLVDAVMASRFIPPSKADKLIEKLTRFISTHQSGELRRTLYTDKHIRPVDEKVYLTVDRLYAAVNEKKKIVHKYYDWGADKKRFLKHDSREFYFSPYGLIWNNDKYYVVGWSDNREKVISLRVDRIADPKLTKIEAAPEPEGFDIEYYANDVFQMYEAEMRDVTLHCEISMMRHILDQFGEDVNTVALDADRFAAHVRVPASPTFFAWVFGFGGAIRIAAPDDVAAKYRDMLTAAMR